MENASKALIIAGAILISIVIIGLGVLVVGNAQKNDGSEAISDTEKQSFNMEFEGYVGNGKSASQVEGLIKKVMTKNMSENGSGKNRFVEVVYNGTTYGNKASYSAITAVPTVPASKTYNITATYSANGLLQTFTVK